MDYEYGDELPVIQGAIGAMQWDLSRSEQEELEESLKRKRPCGFAPWPQEEGNEIEQQPVLSGSKDAVKPRSRRRK